MPQINGFDLHNWNKTLAQLLGWTNIEEMGGALLGLPPPGKPHSRGQAMVPDWANSWEHCGKLMSEYKVIPKEFTIVGFGSSQPTDPLVLQERFATKFRIEVIRLVVNILRTQQTPL